MAMLVYRSVFCRKTLNPSVFFRIAQSGPGQRLDDAKELDITGALLPKKFLRTIFTDRGRTGEAGS